MPPPGTFDLNLVAPCGIYCGTCRHYLAREKGRLTEKHLKHGCRGCRARDKNCTWIRKICPPLRKKEREFCFACDNFPCENLRKLDERHVRKENVSPIENLLRIREIGAEKWLEEQEQKWLCPECGGAFCSTDRECYDCGYRKGKVR